MLQINTNIQGLSKLQKHIDYVEKLLNMKVDKNFQKYIQEKTLETAHKVTDEKLIGGTTNDMAIPLYKQSHKIREDNDGFILYNDATIMADAKDTSGYPNEEFSIALAFEYGVGIVGENTPNNENAWNYNIHNYNFGWWFVPENGEFKYQQTAGYMGFEIYRNIAIEVNNKLKEWVYEYYRKEVQ